MFPVRPALFCALVMTCSGQTEQPDLSGPCDSAMFAKVDSCCHTPQFLPVEELKGCIEEMGQPDEKDQPQEFQDPEVYSTQKMENFSSGAGGPLIIIDCMFKKQNLLSMSGHINVPAIEAKFTTVADSTWRPVVKEAILNCTSQLAKFKLNLVEESSLGNLAPALFMACLRRNLTLNCPESAARKNDPSCVDTLSVVGRCDAFSLGTGPNGGGGGWFGGVLRWMAGPQEWGRKGGPGKQGPKSFFFPIFRMFFPFG